MPSTLHIWRMRLRLSDLTQRLGLLFVFVFIAFATFQISLYQRYAFEATVIYAKDALGTITFTDKKKLGAICNTLGRVKCSVRLFTELNNAYPNDSESIANLAVALTMADRALEAQPFYKAYFAGGGKALDVMYWYGQTLKRLGRDSEAITWFYNILYYQVSDASTVDALLKLLVENKRFTEAQSMLASLLNQSTDAVHSETWQRKIKQLPIENAGTEVYLPALDGRRFFVPVTMKSGKLNFIEAAEDQQDTVLNSDDALQLGWVDDKSKKENVMIEGVRIGPLTTNKIEAKICNDCKSQLGARMLSQLQANIDNRGKVPYLVLRKGE